MLILLAVFILAVGYVLVKYHPALKYKMYRLEGQHLYLLSAFWGSMALLVSFLLNWVCFTIPNITPIKLLDCTYLDALRSMPECIEDYLTRSFGENDSNFTYKHWARSTMIVLGIIPGAGLVLAIETLRAKIKYIKYGWKNTNLYIIGDTLSDSPLDEMLYHCYLTDDEMLMLSLKNRKVYIAKVVGCGEPSDTSGLFQEILIEPFASGYRDESTLELKITTRYNTVFEATSKKLTLALPQNMIESATVFDVDSFERFTDQKREKETDKKHSDSSYQPKIWEHSEQTEHND